MVTTLLLFRTACWSHFWGGSRIASDWRSTRRWRTFAEVCKRLDLKKTPRTASQPPETQDWRRWCYLLSKFDNCWLLKAVVKRFERYFSNRMCDDIYDSTDSSSLMIMRDDDTIVEWLKIFRLTRRGKRSCGLPSKCFKMAISTGDASPCSSISRIKWYARYIFLFVCKTNIVHLIWSVIVSMKVSDTYQMLTKTSLFFCCCFFFFLMRCVVKYRSHAFHCCMLQAITAALDKIPFLQGIVECIVEIINAFVAPWILERGGWVRVSQTEFPLKITPSSPSIINYRRYERT